MMLSRTFVLVASVLGCTFFGSLDAQAVSWTKKVYKNPTTAATRGAASIMNRATIKYGLGTISAKALTPTLLGKSPAGRAYRYLVSSPGDIPGDLELSVLKVPTGWRAAKQGKWGAQ